MGGIDAVKGAAKKALAAQEQTLEHNDHATASLQGIKQVCEAPLCPFLVPCFAFTELLEYCCIHQNANAHLKSVV